MSEAKSRLRPGRKSTPAGFLLEVAAIVLSVMVALAANEWRQSRSDKQLVERLKSSIRAEMSRNLAEAEELAAYHSTLITELRQGTQLLMTVPASELDPVPSTASAVRAELLNAARTRGLPDPKVLRVTRLDSGGYRVVADNEQLRAVVEDDGLKLYGRAGIRLRPGRFQHSTWETMQMTRAAVQMDYSLVTMMAEIVSMHKSYAEITEAGLGMLYFGNVFGKSLEVQVLGFVPLLEDMTGMENTLVQRYRALLEALPPATPE